MMNKVLVLCSGGPDGVIAAESLHRDGLDVTLLHFQYGQRNGARELQALTACGLQMSLPFRVYDLVGCFPEARSAILKGDIREGADSWGDNSYLPARNLILFSIAAGIAESLGDVGYLAHGNHARAVDKDDTIEFSTAFDKILPLSLSRASYLRCLAPVNHLDKTGVIRLGLELKVPFELTWSCFMGGDKPCGNCDACLTRAKAFAEIGVRDPAL